MHLCIPSHGLKKNLTCPRRVNGSHKNTPNMHLPQRQNTSMVEFKKKKKVTYAKISPKMVNPRDIAGECRRRRKSTSEKLKDPLTSVILKSLLQELVADMV